MQQTRRSASRPGEGASYKDMPPKILSLLHDGSAWWCPVACCSSSVQSFLLQLVCETRWQQLACMPEEQDELGCLAWQAMFCGSPQQAVCAGRPVCYGRSLERHHDFCTAPRQLQADSPRQLQHQGSLVMQENVAHALEPLHAPFIQSSVLQQAQVSAQQHVPHEVWSNSMCPCALDHFCSVPQLLRMLSACDALSQRGAGMHW
jgi:hypothetical protein